MSKRNTARSRAMLERLERMPPRKFEVLLERSGVPLAALSSDRAPQAERAFDLLQHFERHGLDLALLESAAADIEADPDAGLEVLSTTGIRWAGRTFDLDLPPFSVPALGPIDKALLALGLVGTVALWGDALAHGLWSFPEGQGFWDNKNWVGSVLWWCLLPALAAAAWSPAIGAWASLVGNGVIRAPSDVEVTDARALAETVRARQELLAGWFRSRRRWLLLAAAVSAVLMSGQLIVEVVLVFRADGLACPIRLEHWAYDYDIPCSFYYAHLVPGPEGAPALTWGQALVVNLLMIANQVLWITSANLAFLQMCQHALLLARFDHIRRFREAGLVLRLVFDVKEFCYGLLRLNQFTAWFSVVCATALVVVSVTTWHSLVKLGKPLTPDNFIALLVPVAGVVVSLVASTLIMTEKHEMRLREGRVTAREREIIDQSSVLPASRRQRRHAVVLLVGAGLCILQFGWMIWLMVTHG